MSSLKLIVHDLWTKNKSSIALVYRENCVTFNRTYGELFDAISCLVLRFSRIKSRRLKYIGILMGQHFYVPVIVLACIHSEKTFVCLDLESGWELNSYILKSLPVSIIFSRPQDLVVVQNIQNFFVLHEEITIWSSTLQMWISRDDKLSVSRLPNIAYAIQTSGSTGVSKIIQVPEQSILPNISDLRSEWDVTAADVILLASPPTFDLFIVEVMVAVAAGAAMFVVDAHTKACPVRLLDTVFPELGDSRVTVAQLTPSVFSRWSHDQIRNRILKKGSRLRVLALGGEQFPPPDLWKSWLEEGNTTRIFNLYGISEVSCWAMQNSGLDGSLGSPLSQTLLRVEDDNGAPITEGSGHLLIGSETRACLIGDEDWANLKFPVFRPTGDIVSVKEGVYRYEGRRDNMVKRWGHRVSLDQVEVVAASCEGVGAACCVSYGQRLALFITLTGASQHAHSVRTSVKATLAARLNKASVPDDIIWRDRLPLTRHGKINRKKLKHPLENQDSQVKIENPLDLLESLWGKYTASEHRGNFGFISEGGNSITAMQLVNDMSTCGINVPIGLVSVLLSDKTLADCQLLFKHWPMESNKRPVIVEPDESRKRNSDQPSGSKSKRKFNHCIDEVMYIQMRGLNRCLEKYNEEQFDLELKTLWSYNLNKCVDASPSLVVFKSGRALLVVGSHSGQLACLNPGDGMPLWDIRLPDRIESSLSPSACGTRGLVGCYDGKVYCVCLCSGDILWSHQTNAMVKSTPLLIDGTWIFGSYDFFVYCLSVSNGSEAWKWRMDGIVSTTPLAATGGLVIVASLAGQVAALCSRTGAMRWQSTLPAPVFSSPTMVADLVLVSAVTGSLHALRPDTGIQVWSFEVGGQIFSSLVGLETSSSIVFGCHDSSVYRVQVGHEAPKLMWRYQGDAPFAATPFPFSPHHLVIASSSGRITVLHSDEARPVLSTKLKGNTFSSPVVFRHSIYIGCRDNQVYCLNASE